MRKVGRHWRRTPHDEAVFGGPGGQAMYSVAAGGPGLVAVGAAAGQNGGQAAAVWTSTDGVVWQRVAHDEAVFGGGAMSSVAAGGPGLVAVGRDDGQDGVRGAAVWVSPDGVVWQRVPHDETVFGGPGDEEMRSVAAGGPGLVAVGRDDGQDGVRGAAVWVSPDGVVWQRVAHDGAVFGGPGGRVMMFSVAAGGPGLVAVGRAVDQDEDQLAAAVWTSPDGVVWQRVAHDEAVFGGPGDQTMWSVAAGGPGLVAVGWDEGQRAAAVWTSTDGVVWQRVAHDEAVFGGPGDQTMFSVAAGGPGLVAVGWDTGQGGDWGAVAVWNSPDGVVWQRVAHDEAVFGDGLMGSVAAGGPGLVAVGRDNRGPAVWVSPSASRLQGAC